MSDLTLFSDRPAPRIADTSREAFAAVQPKRLALYKRILAALEELGEATGGELAAHLDVDILSTRPRLTELDDAGWIVKLTARRCRVRGTSAHPYQVVLPVAALERAIETAQQSGVEAVADI